MKVIDFLKNWGGKLDGAEFTTMRLEPVERVVGEEYEVICAGESLGTATLYKVEQISLNTLTEEIAREDVGCSLAEAKATMRELYPTLEDATPMDYLYYKFNKTL